MMDRRAKFLWMKEILDHLGHCYEQWQVADELSEHFLAESVKRDLTEFRRLCESLRGDSLPSEAHAELTHSAGVAV